MTYTTKNSLKEWQAHFENHLHHHEGDDGSHDISHFRRVSNISFRIADMLTTSVDKEVLLSAAYFHDIVNPPKNSPQRSLASRLSAVEAQKILRTLAFPEEKLEAVAHAIEAHSFSANITPTTLEAKILQDADRMEAIGVLGVLRTFYIYGRMGTKLYHKEDPMGEKRELNDREYAFDHFEIKLLRLIDKMQTDEGKSIAMERQLTLKRIQKSMLEEIASDEEDILAVAEICRYAGEKKLPLFHSNDPFAKQRAKEPKLYALDAIIERNSSAWYLAKLEEELHV